jgi:predicted esterase
MRSLACLLGAVMFLPSSWVAAQEERYELGRRLRQMEAAWERQEQEAARRKALEFLQPLTRQFFAFRYAEAARSLDRATFALQSPRDPSPARQWAAALQITPQKRLLDDTQTELTVTVQPFYKPAVPLPGNARLRLWLTEKTVVSVPIDAWPLTVRVPLPPLGEQDGLDRRLYVLLDAQDNLQPASVGISQIARLTQRLDKLAQSLENRPAELAIETATIRTRLATFRATLRGEVPITDFPFALWLENAELMAQRQPFFTPQRHGQFWLSIPTASGPATPCRLFVPKGLQPDRPVPLVVALHGAGVDENMFFESYGSGQIVRECQQRGWLLLAPRSGLLGAPPVLPLIDTLAQRYPIDRQRIFLVGHSMGAAQATSLALSQPEAFAAVAALGAAPRLSDPQRLRSLPFFLGVGSQDDLAIAGARALHKKLAPAQLPHYRFREYPNLEHLTIVREALPDVFAFFDTIAQPKKTPAPPSDN